MTPTLLDPGPWAEASRILAVRLDAMGDVLMTSPALRALKGSRPGRHLTLLTSPSGAGAAKLLPEVDETIVQEVPWMKGSPARGPWEDLAALDRLRAGRFDGAAIFTVYSQNPLPAALFCHLAGIPLRLAHCRENPYQLLSHWVPDPDPGDGPVREVRHEVRRQLDLVAAIGARADDERLAVRIPEDAADRASARLKAAGIDADRAWIAVHPGCTAPSRTYPAEGFADAAGRLARDHGVQVAFTGSEAEAPRIQSIRAGMGAPSATLAGRLDLGELAAILRRAALLIANNTGPVHLAAAVGTPVVDLYAGTNYQHMPWGIPHRVLTQDVPCAPCYKSTCLYPHHDCLRRISPKAIVEAALELLGLER